MKSNKANKCIKKLLLWWGGGGADKREYFIEAAAISLPRPAAPQILSIAVDAASCKWRKKIA